MTGLSGKDPRIPVIVVVGGRASGKTRLLNRLLEAPPLRDTVVVHGGESLPGAIPLTAARSVVVAATDPDPSTGCLCCGMRSGVGDALRDLFLKALSRRIPPVGRVVIESGAPDAAALRFTLKHAPFLGQRYRFASSLLLIDARQVLDDRLASGLQAAAGQAQIVLLSYRDLMAPDAFAHALATVGAWVPDKPLLPADDLGVEALVAVGLH